MKTAMRVSILVLIGLIVGACSSPHANLARSVLSEVGGIPLEVDGNIFGSGSKIVEICSVVEIEKETMKEIAECTTCPQVPFGYANDKWEIVKSKIKSGDTFFYFRSDTASWKRLSGREGYAVIRQKTLVGVILVRVN